MAKKRYSYAVGACGPTIMYTTIYAENAEEAARIRYKDQYDSFSEEQKKMMISYFEAQDEQREENTKAAVEKQLQYQMLEDEDFPEIEEKEFDETTRDAVGNSIKQGDIVAIVYHPEAYTFTTKAAVVVDRRGQYIITQLLGTGEEARFKVGNDGISYPRTVRIQREFPVTEEEEKIDSVGHAIHIGDTVAFRKPKEGYGGASQKGFEKGGVVTRMTDKMVFFMDSEGHEKRKGYSSIVVY